SPGVRRGKRAVAGRMPILRQHHVLEAPRKPVDERHDLVAARNGKRAARTEIILNVDDQQDVAIADLVHHMGYLFSAGDTLNSGCARTSSMMLDGILLDYMQKRRGAARAAGGTFV